MQESMNAPNVVQYGYTLNIITRLDEATFKPPRSGVKASWNGDFIEEMVIDKQFIW